MNLVKAKNYSDLSKKAAQIIAGVMIENEKPVLGLATGSTPIGTYKELIRLYEEGVIDFSNTISFNLDEYIGLEKSHPQSYYYFMNENLFSKVNMPVENIYIPSGVADDMELECSEYEGKIKKAGRIDLQLLGLGPNGHIGFNEPNNFFPQNTHKESLTNATIEANARFFASAGEVPTEAVTMGIGTIMQAKKVLLICSGDSKANALRQMLFGDVTPRIPASILRFHPNCTVIYSDINI